MNTDYLRSLLEVVSRGSFSEAARSLGMSQPTISFHVQRLEEEANAKLLDRQGGRVVPTDAGRAFVRFAERVLAEQEALRGSLSILQKEVGGRLSLGASTIPGEYILPRMLGAFLKRYPAVEAAIIVADTSMIVDKVQAREVDVGFIGAEVKRRGLVVRRLQDDEVLLLTPPDHPFARRKSIRVADLEGQALVAREEGSGTQRSLEQLLKGAGFSLRRCRWQLVVGSSQAVITAVEAGVGLGFVSALAAEKSIALRRARTVSLQGLPLKRGIYYAYPDKHAGTRLLQTFLAYLAEASPAG
ncbi:MAG: LysR family transcriptional regulator [Chloroflexi bacterium]|nr:LysR family transcriptional regulator [Chloroflexota bacterium]